VAGFAQRAGWRGGDLATAVAIALHASAGNDLAHDVAHPGPVIDRRGLWAIDVAQHPDLLPLDLFRPEVNADAAHALYVGAGRAFTWSAHYVAGLADEAVTAAVRAAQRPARGDAVPIGPDLGRLDELRAQTITAVRRLRNYGR
jgi:hypothetical protein